MLLCLWFNIILNSVIVVIGQGTQQTTSLPDQSNMEESPVETLFPISSERSDTTSSERSETTTSSHVPTSIEILRIYVPLGMGNAVRLIWGHNADYNFNFTYGIHYGTTEEELIYPKNTTMDCSTLVKELEYCTKYLFAVSVNNENKINPNNIRSIVTEVDRTAAPVEFTVDFEPKEEPCLLIKWSASCANIGEPIGYTISIFDHIANRSFTRHLPETNRADYVYPFKVNYDEEFDINVSTDFPESKTTENITYKVPGFLQPYRIKANITPEGAFLIYWSEPYVPYYVERYYYEVYIYRGPVISADHEKLYVEKPAIIYSGDESVYTFIIGLVSNNQRYRSALTNPLVATISGATTELSIFRE